MGNPIPDLKVGDTVAIRGDKRWNYNLKKCCYYPEQLVDGKYVKHMGTGKVWTGKITEIFEDAGVPSARLGNSTGAWGLNLLEKYPNIEDPT